MLGHIFRLCAGAALLFYCAATWANPLAVPGNSGLRHDVQILADAGVLSGPVNTWPLAWPQVYADLQNIPDDKTFPRYVSAALARIRSQLRLHKKVSGARSGAYVRGGTDPQFLRTFDDTPRAQAVTGAYTDWISGHFAGRLELSVAADPEDDREVRLDGSWVGAALGNWLLAAGFLDRYWGPAWQGGLIVSNNARPRAGVTLRRLRTTPFETKWLSWIGPWQFTVFTERLESGRAVPNALLAGMRFAFRPFESLEIGLSRTSQFGGEGNDVGFDTIGNVIAGTTNENDATVGSAKGINQLGGGDIRWRLPYVNAAVYGEFIGEDEVNNRPAKFLAQGGLEIWGGIGDQGASWRLVYERADTKDDAFNEGGGLGSAYNNGDFRTGYRYRGRALGYPADGDALLSSVRAILTTPRGHTFRIVGTTGAVNRGSDPRNSLTVRDEDVDAIDFGYAGQFPWFSLNLGLGYTYRDFAGGHVNDTHAWVGLSREFL